MKIKTRLIIAFFVITLVPFALFGVAFYGFSEYQIGLIEKSYGVQVTLEDISDTMQLIGRSTQNTFESMKAQADEDPQRFLDKKYLEELNIQLRDQYSWILARVDGEIYYDGSAEDGGTDARQLLEELPAFRSFSSASDGGSYIGKGMEVFVKQLDVELENGSEESIFIVSTASKLVSHTNRLFKDLVISVVVILIFTAAVMTIWIYSGMRNSLKTLSDATQRIKHEDFDFEIKMTGKDELSELCRDFDEMRQRLKEQAEQKEAFDRQSKELISNISHDLKTPITAVKGYVEGIMDGVADTPEKMDRYIRTIYNKANDMDHLINELTFYSKIDTNRIPYEFSQIHVVDYFDDCAEEVGLELRERNITFSYLNLVDKDTVIIADAEQMKRVVNNIISNSVKYIDKPKGYVQIRVKDAGDFIQVEIEDNGKGIAKKELVSIFDRFYRTDASRNSAQGGSGIGLSIVKKIIEDHGGRIWANSKVGQGTIMYFVIRKYQVQVE